jgi:hypothetical protein
MDLLMITLAVGLVIYLSRRDIFVSHFKLGIKVLGLNLELKAKEKNGSPSSNRSNPK